MTATNHQTYREHAQKIELALTDLPVDHPLRALLADSAKLLTQAAESSNGPAGHDNTQVALTDKRYHWREIGPDTPRGSKVQLIHRWSGVAIYGTIGSNEKKFFTHWAPLPTFMDRSLGR
jgi:hypothetical protein